ncbi:MAG: hypothetical protein SNJ63_06710 [Sphingomonadaceae bacterium]
MGDLLPLSRRESLQLAALAAVPAMGAGAAAGTAEARLGEQLLAERGEAWGRALLSRADPQGSMAADFRAGRTVAIAGFLFSHTEAARFLLAAGLRAR